MGIIRRIRQIQSAWRRAQFKLLSGQSLPASVHLEKRVRLQVTDGGRLSLQPRVAIQHDVDIILKNGLLEIGADSYIGPWSVLCARESIRIGRDCLIAEMVVIRDQNHRLVPHQVTRSTGYDVAPVTIGNNVWIGAKATILPGVSIGDNAVIGANAVVTCSVPANTIFVGVPARKLRDIE